MIEKNLEKNSSNEFENLSEIKKDNSGIMKKTSEKISKRLDNLDWIPKKTKVDLFITNNINTFQPWGEMNLAFKINNDEVVRSDLDYETNKERFEQEHDIYFENINLTIVKTDWSYNQKISFNNQNMKVKFYKELSHDWEWIWKYDFNLPNDLTKWTYKLAFNAIANNEIYTWNQQFTVE